MSTPERLGDPGGASAPGIDLASVLFLFVLFLLFFACPTAFTRRLVLLVALRKQWDSDYLLHDWMFSAPHYNHLVFNYVFGLPTRLLPLELVALVGAAACWTLNTVALLRLGRFYGISRGMATLGIALWLIYDQALVGGEYILGTFESKSVAYVFLLFALNGFLERRYLLPAALLGLSFSFHPAVGLWGGLAIGLALLLERLPLRELLKIGAITIVFALPGAVPLFVEGLSHPAAAGESRFLALVLFPNHMDPLSWPKRSMLLLYLLLLFNALQARGEDNAAIRFLVRFQVSLAVIFTLGLICRVLELYGFLRYMPFRLFPVFIPLLFFFHLTRAYQHRQSGRSHPALGVIGLFCLLSLGDPVGRLVDLARLNLANWTAPEEDAQKALRWVAAHTPRGSVVVAPPWRRDTYYLSERAQVATWEIYAHDRPVEWRERMEALVGSQWDRLGGKTWDQRIASMDAAYSQRSIQDIQAIVRKYGGDYLVTRTAYPFDLLFDTGTYKVYALAAVGR